MQGSISKLVSGRRYCQCCFIDIFIHHKMIVVKKINDISQEISYDVFREQCTEVQTETLYDSN